MPDLDFSNVDFAGIDEEVDTGDTSLGIEPAAPPLSATMGEAFKTNPDAFAKQKQLSRDTGVPVAAVEGGELELEADVKFNTVDFVGLEFDNQGTSEFLKNYDNAVVAQDDVSTLQRIEDIVRSIPAGLVEGFGMGTEGIGRGIEAGGRMVERGLDVLIPDVVQDSDIGQAIQDLNNIITPYVPGSVMRRQGGLLKEQAEDIADVPAERQTLLTDIGKGLGQVSGQIVTTLVNPSAAVGLMFGQGIDQQGERQEASGTEGTSITSDMALFGGGAITAATEKMGLDALMNRIPPQIKNKIARQLADVSIAGGIEAVQEVVEGVAQGYLEQITTNEDAEIFEGLDREAAAAAGTGAIVRAFVNMLTPGRVRSTEEQTEQVITQGEHEQNIITKLNDEIVSTKLKERDAATMKTFIEQVDGDQNTNIFIDGAQAAMFMQEKTPEEIAADPALELIKNQVREAAALGGDVVIPLDQFAESLAGTEAFTALQPHMTLSPEAVTPFRADQAKQETENYVKGLMTQAEEASSAYIESQVIYEDVKQQLVDTGQVNERNAKVMAQVVPAWATVYAQKNGISVQEAYERSGLNIEGPQTGERARLEGELELLSQPEVQQMLSMDEDAFIQAVNPEGKVIADDDIMQLNIGDLDLPETTETVSSFEADGQTINVVSDDTGNMYAVSDDGVLGMVGPAEDNETTIDLVSESKGKGVGKELAKAYMRQNPMAPAGGFTKAGEATYRAAFRELKAEQAEMLKQSSVLPDRFAIIDAVKGRTPIEGMIETASGLSGQIDSIYTDDFSEFNEINQKAIESIENVKVVHSSRPDKMATVWDESGKVYRVINGKVSEVSTEQDPNSDLNPSQGLTLNIFSNVFREARNKDPKEIEAQRIRELRTTETRRRQERLKSIPEMPADFDQALQQLANWSENLEEFKKALNPDMFDISDRNLTRLGRATMSLDEEFETAGDEGTVTIYRALPEGEEIEAGDWVSFDEVYASGHETNVGEEGGTTVSMEVPADEVYTPGADENEWVYIPKNTWGDITSIDELWQSLTDGTKPDTYPEVEGGQLFAQSSVAQDQTETPEFKAWSDNGEVVEPEDVNDYTFSEDTPVVLKVFHGTTHEFSVFDALRGNMEGQFGAVNYFTSSEQDAHDNYAGKGPDLTSRIEQRAEQLAYDLEDQFEEKGRDNVLQSLHRSLKLPVLVSGDIADADDHDAADLAARAIAEMELSGGQDQTLELYVKVTNPFVIGEDAGWIEFIDDAEIQELAIEEVASDEDVDVDEVRNNIEDYEEQIDEARWRVQEDQEHPLTEAIQTVSSRHDIEASELASQVYDLGESAKPEDIENLLRTSDDYAYADDPETGELIGSQLIAEVIQEMGYDSIILKNAEERFSTMNMTPGTTHVHIFDSGKTNIKSVENQGTFDATDPDIFRQSATKEDVDNFAKELEQDLNLKSLFMFKDRNGDLKLETIIVDKSERSSGKGTEAMEKIVDFADRNGMRVVLTPAVQDDFQGTTSRSRLVKFYKRFGFVENKGRNKDFSVNADAMYRESSLTQDDTDKGTRGYYDPANSMIRLTESADLSTFLHEFAHFMYEMELKAGGETATDIQKWFKRNAEDVAVEAGEYAPNTTIIPRHVNEYIDNGTTGDAERDVAIRRAVHEQFARGFETYLMEGKAPSVELRNVFRTFARWLTEVYKSIRGQLNVNLDEEMRQVFDRMLATEEQIEQAETRARYQPMFTDAAMGGMTEEEFKAYNEQQTKVKDVQSETLREKLINELTRTTKKWWKEQKADIHDAQLEQLKNEKVYRTQEQLRTGDIKLDLAVTKEMVGEQATDKLGRQSIRIPAKLNNMTKPGGEGIHPDEAAAIFGYESGSQMLHDLINVENIKKVADERAEEIMKAEHGDILNDGTIEKEADEAVQSEERGKLMLQELKLLRRGINQPALERQTIKAMAEEAIGKLPYNQIFPNKYRKAEIKAAQESATALAEGDQQRAANAKSRQVLNYYLGIAATEARNGTEKIVTDMARYNKRKVREEIMKNDHGYWEQIEKILVRFDFRKSATMKSVDEYNESLQMWVANRMEEVGDELSISNYVLNELNKEHWKRVPYAQLQGINDSVRNIEHVARYGNKMDYLNDKVDFETLVANWRKHLAEQPSVYKPKIITTTEDKSWLRVGMAQMTKIPFLASWLDGGERVGMSHDIMMDGLNVAQKAEQDMWKSVGDPVMDAILNRSKEDIARHMRSVYVPELPDGNMQGSQVLAVALNTGNDGNLRKMLLGEGWADPEIEEEISIDNPKLQAVLKHMTKSDWDLVQLVWDQMDKLYKPLAEVHRKTTGLTPGAVEASSVDTPFGSYRGGYYPVVYDHHRSGDAAVNKDRADAMTESMFGGNLSLNAQVNAGATNERTGYYGPINLNLDVIPNHFQETIHYITHHDPIRQLNRLITDKRIRNDITEKVGPDEYAQLKPWLNDIAKDGRGAPPKTFIDAAFGQLRMGVTLGVMGFKASTGIIQLSGIFNTYAEVGTKHTNQALRTVYSRGISSINDSVKFAFEHSNVMENRTKTMDREIKNAMSQLSKKRGVIPAVQEASMKHIAFIQFYGADLVSWHAAYTAKLEESGNPEQAYKYADWVVENVQGSGATKDMATLIRSQSKIHTTMTMFMTFFSSLWNMERDVARGAKSGRYSVTSIAAKAMFLFTLPVLFEMLMRGEISGEDEDELAQSVLTKLVLYPIASVPFVRDVASGIGNDYGYTTSPVASMLEKGIQGSKGVIDAMVEDDDITKFEAKSTSQLLGAAFKIPGTSQAWATGEHIWDVINEGEELTFHQLLFGPTKEQ